MVVTPHISDELAMGRVTDNTHLDLNFLNSGRLVHLYFIRLALIPRYSSISQRLALRYLPDNHRDDSGYKVECSGELEQQLLDPPFRSTAIAHGRVHQADVVFLSIKRVGDKGNGHLLWTSIPGISSTQTTTHRLQISFHPCSLVYCGHAIAGSHSKPPCLHSET